MASFAVLGATGSTGSSITKVLLQQEKVSIHVLVRSKAKLFQTIPGIESDPRLQVFEGNIVNIDVLTECIRGTKAVFLAVAINDNMPGCTIAMDTARSVVAALERLKQEKPDYELPRLEYWGVKSVFIKPGGLVHDDQKGHELSVDKQQTFLSFLDLAAGMVEAAQAEDGRWDTKDVSVVPTAKDVKIEWRVPYFVLQGFLMHFFPWLWKYLH
ncbi:hypothetical protein LTR87_016566 [Friedmanniomyces endolithicus]|nr:hypothetical protein LTR87_016566 [Friedmanniomyces endolithicus]